MTKLSGRAWCNPGKLGGMGKDCWRWLWPEHQVGLGNLNADATFDDFEVDEPHSTDCCRSEGEPGQQASQGVSQTLGSA